MAPAFAIPRLLARRDLTYADIHLWEIHEAFAAQVAFHLKALQDDTFLRDRAKVPQDGHPFGATGAVARSRLTQSTAILSMRRVRPSRVAATTRAGPVTRSSGCRLSASTTVRYSTTSKPAESNALAAADAAAVQDD